MEFVTTKAPSALFQFLGSSGYPISYFQIFTKRNRKQLLAQTPLTSQTLINSQFFVWLRYTTLCSYYFVPSIIFILFTARRSRSTSPRFHRARRPRWPYPRISTPVDPSQGVGSLNGMISLFRTFPTLSCVPILVAMSNVLHWLDRVNLMPYDRDDMVVFLVSDITERTIRYERFTTRLWRTTILPTLCRSEISA